MQRIGTLATTVFFVCAAAGADDYTWNNTDGNWSDSTQWTATAGGIPATADVAIFYRTSGNENVTVDGNFGIDSVLFDAPVGTTRAWRVYGSAYTLTVTNTVTVTTSRWKGRFEPNLSGTAALIYENPSVPGGDHV